MITLTHYLRHIWRRILRALRILAPPRPPIPVDVDAEPPETDAGELAAQLIWAAEQKERRRQEILDACRWTAWGMDLVHDEHGNIVPPPPMDPETGAPVNPTPAQERALQDYIWRRARQRIEAEQRSERRAKVERLRRRAKGGRG